MRCENSLIKVKSYLRLFVPVFLVTGFFIFSNISQAASLVDSNDLAIWHFDETSGGTAHDSSSNHLDLTWSSNPWGDGRGSPERTIGRWDLGINFRQYEENYSVTPSSPIDFPDGLTVGAWIKMDLNSTDQSRFFWLGNTFDYAGNPANFFSISVENGLVRLDMQPGGGSLPLVSTKIVSDNNWHFIVARFDVGNGAISIFVDGQEEAGSSLSFLVPVLNIVNIGRRESYFASRGTNFSGVVDDVWLRKQVLTNQEIADFYQSNQPYKSEIIPPTNVSAKLIAHYNFDDPAGGTASDSSGNNYDLQWSSNPWGNGEGAFRSVIGKFVQAANFKKVEDLFSRSFSPVISFPDGVAIGVWAKTTETSLDTPATIAILGNGVNYAGDLGSLFSISEYQGHARLDLKSGYNYSLVSSKLINDGQWHFYTMVVDARPNFRVWKLFVDGNLESEAPFPSVVPDLEVLKVGWRENYFCGSACNFAGDVDDLFILSSPISSEKVKEIYDSNKAYLDVSGFSNVLFLPGAEGSRLYKPDYNGGTTKLWEPNGNNNQIENLSLNSVGIPDRNDVYTRDVIDHAYVPTGIGDVYKSFLEQLDSMKNTEHLINDYSAVPYDWRLSMDDLVNNGNKLADGRIYYSGTLAQTSTPYIIKELRRLAAGSKTGKVTIVAHSMGGLVTKELTDKLGLEASSLIDKIIFVAVPQAGTPKAIGALLHGFDMALPKSYLSAIGISNSAIRDLGQNMPSAFNLLPSLSYFTSVNDPVITFDNSPMLSPWREKYGSAISSAGAMHNFLTDQSREILPTENDIYSPPVLNEFLLNKAEAFHGTFDNWTPPVGVKLTEIAGWGVETIKTVEYYRGWDSHCGLSSSFPFVGCIAVESLKYRPETVLDGDDTVLAPSALWIPESASVKRYFVDLKSYNEPFLVFDRSHGNIFEVPQLRTFIENIIVNSTDQLPEFISNSAPQNSSINTQLHFILHSPLSLDLYDDQGNHTGLSSTTNILEENIPGSSYQEFGEVKYISAQASANLHLAMKGYDNGSFTLDVEEVRGDEIISTTTFAAVPVVVGAIATLDIPKDGGVANISPLSVDENGDGISDITLVSKPGEVVIPDFVPPATTASVSGVAGLKGWYVSDASISFTATDSDTGVKQTFYSLDNGATYNNYTAPFKMSTEGTTTILYYSTDNQGNKEEAKVLLIKIDKTAPEPKISIDPPTKDLKVEGLDNLSQTVVLKTSNIYTITDEAGNTTKLFFQKTFAGKLLTIAKLTGVQYGNNPIINLPSSSFVYLWNPLNSTVLSQTIAVNKTYVIEAVYDSKKNQTTVLLKDKGLAIQKKIFTGFHASKLILNKGVVGYEL